MAFTKDTKLDTFYFIYFLVHIPITVLIDSSIVIPEEFRFGLQKSILEFHMKENKDFLLMLLPNWLRIGGMIELVFQLPTFFVALYCLQYNVAKLYPLLMTYGFNASLTTLFCLYEIYVYDNEFAQKVGFFVTSADKEKLFMVYLPTFVIPTVMFVDFGMRCYKAIGKKVKQD